MKIAIKPQSEYTAEELKALDEWAAGFVGMKQLDKFGIAFHFEDMTGYFSVKGKELRQEMSVYTDSCKVWHPSSTDAPLCQLGMVLEKADETMKNYEDILFSTLNGLAINTNSISSVTNAYDTVGFETDAILFIFQNPATILAAIMQTIGEE